MTKVDKPELVEAAKIIHEQMVWANEQPGPAQVWQNGNSTAEYRARRAARDILDLSTGSEATREGDPDVFRRLASVATTLETCGKHGIPIDFALLAHDIRAALAAISGEGR